MHGNKIVLRKKHLVLAVSAALSGTVTAQELEEVTVTGSRIVRRDLTAPSPILTINQDRFVDTGSVNIENTLNQLPQFVPAGTEFGGGIQIGATNSPGAATLNLRGLGTNRNLVLVDGRRAQPVNASLVVDVNTIPSAAIRSVEVITGGAAAVYGPDALAGVTNFILRDDFEGVEFGMRSSQTAEGDANQSNFNILLGVNAADGRGNIMMGMDFTERDPSYQIDRDFYRNGWLDPANPGGQFQQPSSWGAGEGNIPGGPNPADQAVVDQLFFDNYGTAPGTVGANSEFRFNPDGSVFVTQGAIGYNGPLNCLEGCGPFTGLKVLNSGNLDQVNTTGYLSTPLTRHSVFARGHYEVADNIRAFANIDFSDIEVDQRGGIPPAITVWQSPIPRDGRPLPDDLNTLLDSRAVPDGDWSLYRVLDYNGPIQVRNKNEVWQLQVGLEGDIGSDISWEAYVSTGETNIEALNTRLPSLQRYQFLAQQNNFGQGTGFAFSGRAYQFDCESGLPIFAQFTPDTSCVDGFDTRMINKSELEQKIAEFNLSGAFGELPGGEIGYAVGASYRENGYSYAPGNGPQQVLDNPIGIFVSNFTGGDIDVKELYGEVLLPVVDRLSLELGYRYSDFSTAGGSDTYKTMFTFDAADSVTLRGGYQFATRAPNVAELFGAPTQVVVGHPDQDPCSVTTLSAWGNVPSNPDRQQVIDLCRDIIDINSGANGVPSGFDTQTYSITGIPGPEGFHRQNPPFFPLEIGLQQGNPGVLPEEGKTFTLGVILNGIGALENLTVTADYYQIELAEAIAPLAVSTVYDNCFNWNGLTNPTYDINNASCQMIRRNPISGDRAEVDSPFSNLGILETNGVDLTVNWIGDVGPGALGINSIINFLGSFEYQTGPTSSLVDATGTLDQGGLYDIQAYTDVNYTFPSNLSIGLGWRYLSDAKAESLATRPTSTDRGPGAYSAFSVRANYGWSNYTVRFGIENLFDTDPELTNVTATDSNSNTTIPAIYDVLGRRWYAGFTASF